MAKLMNTSRPPRRPICFLRTLFISLFLLAGVIFGVAYVFFNFSEDDITTYHSLMAEANPTLANKVEKSPYTATQQQQNVRKDVFFSKGSDRLHFVLSSEDSNVILDHKHGNTALFEELDGVRAYAQQELLYVDEHGNRVPKEHANAILKQKVFFGSAEKAFVSYNKITFQAEQVHGVAYEAPGHELVLNTDESQIAEPIFSLEAKRAGYDGKQFMLEGNVRVDHALGSALGDQLIVKPMLRENSSVFDTFILKDNVLFTLKNKGILLCQRAEFDYAAQCGRFYGGSLRDPFVLFRSTVPNDTPEHKTPSIELKSRSMEMFLSKESKGFSKNSIKTLQANDEVSIDYSGEMRAYADQALYQYSLDGYSVLSLQSLPGIITLSSNNPSNACRIINPNGDQLVGSSISIDTNLRHMHVSDPVGTMQASASNLFSPKLSKEMLLPHSSNIQMKSDHLLWDFSQDLLVLQGNAVVDHSDMGTFKSDREVRIYYSGGNGKKQLRAIESDGRSVICHQDVDKQDCHWLICNGNMRVDHHKMEVLLQSPIDPQGNTCAGKQVFYYDNLGEVQADKATIYYQNIGEKLAVSRLTLEGNVYIVDHKGMKADGGENKPLHYALADFVEYTPNNRQMYLGSRNGRRVLFYDKINQLQVSAPALRITRDQQTKKEAIKGFGDVRFNFLNAELEQLLKRSTFSKVAL